MFSKKSSSNKSSKSSRSKSSNGRTSIKERALEEKLKLAELMAEAPFIEEKHAAIYNAEKLRHTEELAKLKARSQILEELQDVGSIGEIKDPILDVPGKLNRN